MKTLTDKLIRTNIVWKKTVPKLVRSMTNDAVTFFKTFVWNNEGRDVQPTSVNGGRWKRRKKANPKPLLTDTGRLRKSLRANARGKVGVVLTTVPYAGFHQRGEGKMPQRKFMGESKILNRKFEKKILKALNRAFEE